MSILAADLNIGLEMVGCYTKYFDHQEIKLNHSIDKLSRANVEIEIISRVMNTLAHAKQKDKKIDLSDNETMKRYIIHIHRNNPTIFEGLIQEFPDHLISEDHTVSTQNATPEDVLKDTLKGIDMGQVKIGTLTEDQIDVVVQGLDAQLKSYSADLNEQMMKIHEHYDTRSQMTESARLVVKQAGEFLESINRKMSR